MSRALGLLTSIAVLSLSIVAGANAAAATGALPLRVVVPVGECSSAAAFFDAVHSRSARVRRAAPGESAAVLEVRLERLPSGGMRGDLRLRLEDGSASTRSVTGASCEAVVQALSLTAALALDSAPAETATESATATPTEPLAATEPKSSTDSRAPTVVNASQRPERDAVDGVDAREASDRREPRRWRAELGLQAAVARVVAPHLNVGGAVAARVRLDRPSVLSPTLGAALLHTHNGLFESSRHATMRLSGLALALCPLRVRLSARLALEPCASVLGAQLRAEGVNLLEPRAVTRSWWGAGGLVRGALAVAAGLQVGLEAGVLVPLVDRRFVVLPEAIDLGRTPSAVPFANVGIFYVL